MFIYKLEIGFKSKNCIRAEVECVDESDAVKTFTDLFTDMKDAEDGFYLLDTEKGAHVFMLRDVEYVSWEKMRDTTSGPKTWVDSAICSEPSYTMEWS